MSNCRIAALAFAALLLVLSNAMPAGQALAEEPDPDPELQADDATDDDDPPVDEVEEAGEAEKLEGVEVAEEADVDGDSDQGADEGDTDDADGGMDDLDDDWAEDVVVDASDDAIPVDLELDPTGEDWFVTEFEERPGGLRRVVATGRAGL